MASQILERYADIQDQARKALESRRESEKVRIQVGSATCENAAGAREVMHEFRKHIEASGRDDIVLRQTGCTGRCSREPIVNVIFPDSTPTKYQKVTPDKAHEIFTSHVLKSTPVKEYLLRESGDENAVKQAEQNERNVAPPSGNTMLTQRFMDLYGDVAFFSQQTRLALRNSGIINPEDIYEYINFDGFHALAGVLHTADSGKIIEAVSASNLRGRGGGGFPTGVKWRNGASQEADEKFVICNADEGDPGAFMDRSMLEGDPFSVIEGMIIGAYAVGAKRGFFYVRAEYPLAIQRIHNALKQAREHGLLGDNILGSEFSFDLEVRLGAGAFVCGEETALIHSIEGARGQPRIRPPYPAEKGLWGKPTIINNVETWANIPVIMEYGSEWFSKIGTSGSGGTKVFALAGKVNHTGLVEVPMGTTLRQIVFDIGGGVTGGKEVKAIQTGGPAGGCLPAKWLDTEVDFDSLMKAGSIMGSGGMIVMDEDDCMVDIAKFFITFS